MSLIIILDISQVFNLVCTYTDGIAHYLHGRVASSGLWVATWCHRR